jgi:hypothetical protein
MYPGIEVLVTKENISTDPGFETGIAKIQATSEQILTQVEKHACRSLERTQIPKAVMMILMVVKRITFLKGLRKLINKRTKWPADRVTTWRAAVVESGWWCMFDAFNHKRRSDISSITIKVIIFL